MQVHTEARDIRSPGVSSNCELLDGGAGSRTPLLSLQEQYVVLPTEPSFPTSEFFKLAIREL